MDVNEEIVKEYFEKVENCIVRNNIVYNNHHSAIDLLAVNKEGEVKDIEKFEILENLSSFSKKNFETAIKK